MDRQGLSEKIKAYARSLGFDLVGITPVRPPEHADAYSEWLKKGYAGQMDYMVRTEEERRHPERRFPWARSVVSVAINYSTPFGEPKGKDPARGWISRYAWGEDYHEIVKEKLDRLLLLIKEEVPEVEGKTFVDTSPILERELAAAAGIGWVGKNTMVISPKIGSYLFLGELFLNIDLEDDQPIFDQCGDCDLCLKCCPTDAFIAPYLLEATRCISYLTIELKGSVPMELRPLLGDQIFGCDICQEVCPYNRKPVPTEDPSFRPREGLYAPELIPFLRLSEEAFKERFKGSPVKRAKRRGFLRNVAVALGNLKCEEAVPALAKALVEDPESLVKAHVAWALGQIGTEEAKAVLLQAWPHEGDPEVCSEIEEALNGSQEEGPKAPEGT
ncbi:MAG: tRNA epoxyqueuosine(34) reductase QueG [candidate division NC10 bacterium]|nr:tRNA epoxyqueuosine(34) reductase QueG [candidate division NC10 bacterium]